MPERVRSSFQRKSQNTTWRTPPHRRTSIIYVSPYIVRWPHCIKTHTFGFLFDSSMTVCPNAYAHRRKRYTVSAPDVITLRTSSTRLRRYCRKKEREREREKMRADERASVTKVYRLLQQVERILQIRTEIKCAVIPLADGRFQAWVERSLTAVQYISHHGTHIPFPSVASHEEGHSTNPQTCART